MCGLVGFAGQPPSDGALERASQVLAHRGPDGHGIFYDSFGPFSVGLAHRRLAILDLSSAANQPMTSACGRFVLAYNGEIFNYQGIRQDLAGAKIPWRTTSDTEVLLEHLARRGAAGLTDCVGMFAIALYDRVDRRVLLARDHLGVKPLYWAEYGGGLLFASEIKALLALGVPARLRQESLGEYLLRGWVQHPDTAFNGVHSLEPGAWVSWQVGELTRGQFWDLQPVAGQRRQAAADGLESLLSQAVRGQLVADRPVGLYVSGGIDSSVIYALAESEGRHHMTLTARFRAGDVAREGVGDDGAWADRLLAKHPADRRADLVMAPDLFREYADLVWSLDEPMADPATVPSYLLARRARELGVVVMLSGMGGDEVFGGYQRYALAPFWSALSDAGWAAQGALRAASRGTQQVGSPVARRWASYCERLAGALGDGWPMAYASLAGQIPSAEVDALVGRDWRGPLSEKLGRSLEGWSESSWLCQAQRLDLKGFLASHNLVYADKTSMAASVEVRVPLLDHRVVEAVGRLPDSDRASLRQLKPWLRRFCRHLVGPEIAARNKAGFTMPIRAWMQVQLAEEVNARLNGDRLASVLRPDAIRRMLDDHNSRRRDNTWKLWTLLTLDLWLERFDIV